MLKIIAISGGSRAMDPRNYLHDTTPFGIILTVSKPFDPQVMTDAVQADLQEEANEIVQ